ncbi:MAG: S24 family peptidase [Candidatus Paceibacterota bacterium]
MDDVYEKKIYEYYLREKRIPVYRVIAKLCGFASTNAVSRLVTRLLESRFLERNSRGKLIPGARMGSVRLLGLVEAGFPSHAEEADLDTITIDEFLIENREASYMLKVKGDSMIDAGICPGDFVIVERKNTAKVGDIIVAEVDQEYTMKYLAEKNGVRYLKPANKKYRPIFPCESLTIVAVVRSVIRKYA